MSSLSPEIRRNAEHRYATITEVDTQKNLVTATDQHRQTIAISFNVHWPATQVPAVGETWLVRRQSYNWYLVGRVETGKEKTAVSTLAPGDQRVEAVNNLYLNGTHIYINAKDLEATLTSLQNQITALQAQITPH